MSFGRGWSGRSKQARSTPPPGATLNDWPPPVSQFVPKEKDVPLYNPRFSVVILSNSGENLKCSLRGLFSNEPGLMDKVVVVDDGISGDIKELPGVKWVPGQKPFIFARNANLGIRAAEPHDVLLLNDDAILQTPKGFTLLAQATRERPKMGICSAGITGHVGNDNQYARLHKGVRLERKKLAFVCVYIPRDTINKIGFLDEQFVGYGYEDDDYCVRATQAGLVLGVFDGCSVEHASVPSCFRAKKDYGKLITQNRLLFEEKWKNRLPDGQK